mgnify:FL=1
MLNLELWTSFEKELSIADVEKLEDRLSFLRDVLEDALVQYQVEDVASELDLNLHIFWNYMPADSRLTPWWIHDSWFYYYSDGLGLNSELGALLKSTYLQSTIDLHSGIVNFLECLNSDHLIVHEVDAVVWLSFLDYMASKLICQIGNKRMRNLFARGSENNKG